MVKIVKENLRGEVHGLVGELDGLLIIEWNSALECKVPWGSLEVKVLVQVINLPEALHTVADVDVDGTMWVFLHLTGQDVFQDLWCEQITCEVIQ